jgi:hypothetical protein
MGTIIVFIPGALANYRGRILFLTDFLRSWLILIESGSLPCSGSSFSVEILEHFKECRERVGNSLCSVGADPCLLLGDKVNEFLDCVSLRSFSSPIVLDRGKTCLSKSDLSVEILDSNVGLFSCP